MKVMDSYQIKFTYKHVSIGRPHKLLTKQPRPSHDTGLHETMNGTVCNTSVDTTKSLTGNS